MRYVRSNLHTSAGSPTDTLLRLLHRHETQFRLNRYRPSLNQASLRCNDGRCVQKAGTYSPRVDDTRILGVPCSRGRFQTSIPTASRFGGPLPLSGLLLIVLLIVMRVWPWGFGAY